MQLRIASWSLFSYVLLVLMCTRGTSARKTTEGHWKDVAMDDQLRVHAAQDNDDGHKEIRAKHVDQGLQDSEQHAHMDHMDPSLNIFFTINDLQVGKTRPIYFPNKDLHNSPHFLPREEADSIPFSLSALPSLLNFFSFSKDSPQAKAMENTLNLCELKPIKGETKFCATSLESMLDSMHGIFGLINTHFKVLTTTHLTNSTTQLQNYTILEAPKEIFASKMVACHTLHYPYAVFYCHCQESENKLFQVLLGGDNGGRVEAVAVCHMDTSQWDRDHVSFRVLSTQPGSSPVCHFFPPDNLVWVPSSPMSV